ncbi:ABC transporter ATP-binding protein [Bacillus sp. JNUCC-22]|uniref:ABC transporter ATP-binding protein n=1 Tax=Bacillus sp. JNUCC-22 TaxID=2842457 RepID=UPI00339D585F
MEILRFSNIKKSYNEKCILFNVNINIKVGEMLSIMGKSGAGKSTILHIMSGLEKASKGDYFFKGKNISGYNHKQLARFRHENIGFIFQNSALIDEKNVFHNVALPLIYSKENKPEIREKVNNILSELELSDYIYKYPKELSGGQAQRVAIARALINEPSLILADEPTGSLDAETEKLVLNLFLRLSNKGKTLVIVTHDQTVADKCDRIVTLKNGVLV